MKKKMRRAMMLVFLTVFVGSTVMLLRQWKDNASGETAYADAMAIAMSSRGETTETETVPEEMAEAKIETDEPMNVWVPTPVEDDPVMDEMAEINISALQQTNADVLGWIRIPDTEVDYPLLQGEDNEFYLQHTWEKTPNSVGSIFLEHLSSPDLTDFNTIIYGHNMGNGSMFSALEHYAMQKHWQTHPYVYIATEMDVYRYEIFAFFRASVESITYGVEFQQDQKKADFLRNSANQTWIETGITPAVTDRIITLSTCSGADYSNRYVVQARIPMMEVRQ